MNLITRLLGKRPTTAPNLASEIAIQNAAIEAAHAKIAAAQTARKVAIEDFDAEGHRAADEDIAEANREIERRENAIEKLKAAHADRIDLDRREEFRREDAALAAEGLALESRISTDYPEAATVIAQMILDIDTFREKHLRMRERATALGEASAVRDPEEFRGAAQTTMQGAPWRPDRLAATVGNLPKLIVGEGFHREAPEPPKPAWAGLR